MNSKTKKIFVFFTWDVSLDIWYNKGLFAREIKYYEALSQQNIHFTFLTWGGKEDRELQKKLPKNIEIIPIYEYLPCPKVKFFRALLSPLSVWSARKSILASDIIKTNQMWGSWCAVIAKFIYRKPLIIRTGFELYKFTIAQEHGFFRKYFIFILSQIAYLSANYIYVSSLNDKIFVEKKFTISPKKISVRQNWIDLSVFSPPLQIKEKTNHSKNILFVGRLTQQKNLPLLFDAIQNSNYVLDIIGDGELKNKLQELSVQKNCKVNFLKTVSNNKLADYYKSCELFILPSLYEGNPKVLLEAMACGCAVIGTNAEGINNIIKHNQTGLLVDFNPHELKAAIDRFYTNHELKFRLGSAAHEQIKSTHALHILAQKEINDYNCLVS